MAGKKHHEWVLGEEPPTIRPHSLAKHRVIAGYLRRYVEVVAANPKIPELRLTLVDGFAGGGVYRDISTLERRDGSPLLMLRAMSEAHRAANELRSKNSFNLDVEYFFIDEDLGAFEYLKKTIQDSEFNDKLAESIHLSNGTFLEHVDRTIERIQERKRGGRAIFVLDQFGYSVPFAAIRKILSTLSNAEVILTFATDFLIDHMTGDATCQKILEKVGLQISPSEITAMKQQREWRRLIQCTLHTQIQEGTGAKYYTPFFVRSSDAHRDFWLVHLSGHARARDVMVAQHWIENTSFAHYGRAGLQMLGYDQDEDHRLTKQKSLPGFYFDATARDLTTKELVEQLGARVPNDSVPFWDLFELITNETPATSEILKDALEELQAEHEIELIDPKTGKRVPSARSITNKTRVVRSQQKKFFFGPES